MQEDKSMPSIAAEHIEYLVSQCTAKHVFRLSKLCPHSGSDLAHLHVWHTSASSMDRSATQHRKSAAEESCQSRRKML